MVEYTITENNLHIVDSAYIGKDDFWKELAEIWIEHTTNPVFERTIYSLLREWATHNFLYNLHIFRSHTKDVDLNAKQKWYEVIGYGIVGRIAWIFIK